MKELLNRRFPTHEVLTPSQHDWFEDLKGRFKRACNSFWIETHMCSK